MIDLLTIGEFLIDFTPKGVSELGNPIFERNPGGAPANVAVQAARLGTDTGFIGKVGDDSFGRFLRKTLVQNGVNTNCLITDSQADTTLAFVSLDESGNRAFTFYRRGTADTRLLQSDLDFSAIDQCKLFHFGALSFTDQPARDTVLEAVKYARSKGKLISYDPNWRPLLWRSREEGIAGMQLGLSFCDILKVSEEELPLLTDCEDMDDGIQALQNMGIPVILLTMGPKGCMLIAKGKRMALPTYDVVVVDTTGSGDSFLGAFLHCILKLGRGISDIKFEELVAAARYANSAGAFCATRFGAIPSMPTDEEIMSLIS